MSEAENPSRLIKATKLLFLNVAIQIFLILILAFPVIRTVAAVVSFEDLILFIVANLVVLTAAGALRFLFYAAFSRFAAQKLFWAKVFAFETIALLLFIGSYVLYLTLGLHLDDQTVINAFKLKDLNFGIEVSLWQGLLAFSGIVLVFLFQWFLHQNSYRLTLPRVFKRFGARPVANRILLYSAMIAWYFGFLTATASSNAVLASVIPGYALVNNIWAEFLTTRANYASLNARLRTAKLKSKPHILMLMSDALRWDQLNPETMPNLARLANHPRCVVSSRHYSGATMTSYGAFGYLYGIESFAVPAFARAQLASPGLKILRANGYAVKGFDASGLLSYTPTVIQSRDFEIYETLFSNDENWQDDAKVVKRIIEEHKKDEGVPQYYFGMFYSTHAPYSYPPGEEMSTEAKLPKLSYLDEGYQQNYFSQYASSARYVDKLVGELVNEFKTDFESGKLILSFVGDHGEEFWEHGTLGHAGTRFEEERTRVPWVFCAPGVQQAKIDLSTNVDVFPTLLGTLGVKAIDLSQLFSGRALLSGASREFAFISGDGFPERISEAAVVSKEKKYRIRLNGKATSTLSVESVSTVNDQPEPTTSEIERAQVIAYADHELNKFLTVLKNDKEPAVKVRPPEYLTRAPTATKASPKP